MHSSSRPMSEKSKRGQEFPMLRRKEQRPAAARGWRQIEKTLCGVAIAREPLARSFVKKLSCVYGRADQSNDQRTLEHAHSSKSTCTNLGDRFRRPDSGPAGCSTSFESL